MHSERIEPAKLILVGTRITYQATPGDADSMRDKSEGEYRGGKRTTPVATACPEDRWE